MTFNGVVPFLSHTAMNGLTAYIVFTKAWPRALHRTLLMVTTHSALQRHRSGLPFLLLPFLLSPPACFAQHLHWTLPRAGILGGSLFVSFLVNRCLIFWSSLATGTLSHHVPPTQYPLSQGPCAWPALSALLRACTCQPPSRGGCWHSFDPPVHATLKNDHRGPAPLPDFLSLWT